MIDHAALAPHLDGLGKYVRHVLRHILDEAVFDGTTLRLLADIGAGDEAIDRLLGLLLRDEVIAVGRFKVYYVVPARRVELRAAFEPWIADGGGPDAVRQ